MHALDLPSVGTLPERWPAGPPDELLADPLPFPGAQVLEEMFMLQWCHVLAHALHDRTGWPVVVVGDRDAGWVHAGVRMPDGQILDVTGRHSPVDWLEDWEYSEPCDGLDDPDVDIYEWEEAHGDPATLTASTPARVRAAAALTSDSLLASLGWHAVAPASCTAEPK